MQAQLSPAERYRLIQDDLARMNLHPNVLLTKANFFELLDSKVSNQMFDREIAAQLYDRMQKDNLGRILIDEFIKVYIEAQDFLTQNLIQSDQQLQEYNAQKQDAVQKLNDLRNEEVLNNYGIMEGSILTVQVLELKQLDRARNKDVSVIIRCGDNTFQTEALHYTEGMSWDEQFKMEIFTGSEMVQMAVLAYGSTYEPEVLGEIVFPIQDLNDQFFRDQLFDLDNPRGGYAGGQIHLKLQWIHSRVKYLETVINKWNENIQVYLEDKEDFEQSLAALNELFPRAQNTYTQSIHSLNSSAQKYSPTKSMSQSQPQSVSKTNRYQDSVAKDQIYQEDYQLRLSQGGPQSQVRSFGGGSSTQRQGAGMVSFGVKPSSNRAPEGGYIEDIPVTTSQTVQFGRPQGQQQPQPSAQLASDRNRSPLDTGRGSTGGASVGISHGQYAQKSGQPAGGDVVIEWREQTQPAQFAFWGSLALLILTMFSCFMKASYLELILCFAFLQNYDLRKRFRGGPETLALIIGILAIGILWSLIWLFIYTGGWGDETLGWEPEGGVLIFVLVVEYLSLFLKSGLVYCYWSFFQLVKARAQRDVIVAGYAL